MADTKLNIKEFLDKDEQKDLLRFLTAGSVDDGKSTLIGRLLFDSKKIYEDQLDALERDSKRMGNAGEHIDYALLLDGLKAEREQGITIDVAYRYFSTNNRKFIIADTPGHEQYTRNMITGGSTANLAIILVDARTGVITQTCRHTYLVSLLGIKHVVLAVNKMDLVDFDKDTFDRIVADYKRFVEPLDIPDITYIPLSALDGDNVVEKSDRTPWYEGTSLLDYLENVPIDLDRNYEDFRYPVQYVLRPNLDFRGFSGKVASGIVRKGDTVMALPSGKTSKVKSIVTYEGELEQAFPPQCITITLEDEIDISRGEMLVHPDNLPICDRNFEAILLGQRLLASIAASRAEGCTRDSRQRLPASATNHIAEHAADDASSHCPKDGGTIFLKRNGLHGNHRAVLHRLSAAHLAAGIGIAAVVGATSRKHGESEHAYGYMFDFQHSKPPIESQG